ncbi:MAG: DNA polymerase III subunit alpha [Deltaproteobacteria bacterium]|nr:DNA polymerase III subunit alpha [Deltaproteobacteria bacterium]
MGGEFTHLHLHSSYSLLDGAIRLSDLFPRVLELGMKSVALTDHGNMFGAVDFFKKAKQYGVKPIFGCETYVAGDDRFDKSNRRNHHLILLARNEEGYKNLSYLNSMGFLEGFYYHPRIDKKILRERSAGLIGLSACLGSEVAQAVMREGVSKAKEVAKEYASIFEPGSYYLEVMPNGLEEQDKVNEAYRTMGRDLGIPVVATNDCHYVNRGDYKAHEILMCIQQKKTVHDENRLHHKNDAYYIKSPGEMEAAFHDWPEVLENTEKIASLCDVELKLGKTLLPRYKVPEGYDLDSYVDKVARDGLERRFQEKRGRGEPLDEGEYHQRLEYELSVIKKMGFSGYFLIVWDFINWAKEHQIPVGPGRGSGAGSVAAWALRITDIDPIPFKLLFERFLNPERVSMPDFDVDFCMNKRDRVIEYVTQKYGKENVGQIATFHQLKSRGVVRDVARALAIPLSEADRIAKLVPEPRQGKPPPIDKAIAEEPRLKELYENDPKVRELLDFAKRLEGLNRHAGMHAAGVVISENPLWAHVPCFKGDNGEIVTQFAKDEVEAAGLVKFDFLGLKTLTVIDTAVKLINQQRSSSETPLDIDKIRIDDPEVYKMIGAGDTTGVFQLESSGMREMLKKLKPDNIEDIVAAVALYRPGPLQGGMVDDFIDRKHGKKKVTYPHPLLEPLLADTYGVIVYQEQVMQIAQVMAGYTLGQADLLRRAMGKKKAEEMAKQKANFLDGAKGRQIPEKIADEVFDLMAKFAEYGFNRSHSAAYALVTYQTAYLKRHFPHEFMAGLLSCDRDNTDNIVKFIAEARAMGLRVERPDVNDSELDFSVVEEARQKCIRFGLGAVKGVGQGAVEVVLQARVEGGPFKSIYDFCNRVDTQKVNRRVVEALIKAGAFDGLGKKLKLNRAKVFAALETALERAAQAQKDRKSGQRSLFGLAPMAAATTVNGETYQPLEEWPPKQLLAFEKECLGFYITGHPLDRFQGDISRYANANTSELEGLADRDQEVSVGGVVTEYKDKPTKSGNGRVAFFNLEDQYGKVEVVVFPKVFEKVHSILTSDEPLLCTGKIKDEGDAEKADLRFILDGAIPLAHARAQKTTRIHILLNANQVTPEQVGELKGILQAHKGSCATYVHLKIPMRSETVVPLGTDFAVTPSDDLLLRLERLFGERVAILQ